MGTETGVWCVTVKVKGEGEGEVKYTYNTRNVQSINDVH